MSTPCDLILAPACKALFGGPPSELGVAILRSRRLRGSYERAAARAMFDARASGDVARCERAATMALLVDGGELPVAS